MHQGWSTGAPNTASLTSSRLSDSRPYLSRATTSSSLLAFRLSPRSEAKAAHRAGAFATPCGTFLMPLISSSQPRGPGPGRHAHREPRPLMAIKFRSASTSAILRFCTVTLLVAHLARRLRAGKGMAGCWCLRRVSLLPDAGPTGRGSWGRRQSHGA